MAKLIKVDHARDHRAKRIRFTALFQGIPIHADCIAAQQKQGYHPAGYGGPDNIVSKPTGKQGEYEATWTCYDNCD